MFLSTPRPFACVLSLGSLGSGRFAGLDPKNATLRASNRRTARNLSGLNRQTNHELKHFVTFQRKGLAQLLSKLLTGHARTILGDVPRDLSAQLSTKRTLTGFLCHFNYLLSYLTIGFCCWFILSPPFIGSDIVGR